MIPTTHSDRRNGARYAMKVPIRVNEVGMGSTVDVSATGVAFFIDRPLEPGSVIGFALTMEEAGGLIELRCDGRVVRVEQRGPSIFTAATIENLALRTTGEH